MNSTESLMAELSRVLWQQRALIEVLQYRLEVQQLMMSAGRDQRLPLAVEEVELTLADIRHLEDLRDRVVRDAAVSLGLAADATLTQICARVEAPWDFVLGDHQPSSVVSGAGADHDVPVTLIARDASAMKATDAWGWQPGLRPGAGAPVWRMDAVRDKVLSAFSRP